MNPRCDAVFLYMLAGLAVVGGLLVITLRKALHSALALIVTLLAVAGLYLMLYAPFVAGVQIIAYAVGIMVLFLFVIVLMSIERQYKDDQHAALQSHVANECSGWLRIAGAARVGIREGQGAVSGPQDRVA